MRTADSPAPGDSKGNGNSLQQAQQLSAATTEEPGPVTPASPKQSPGYRLGGPLDPEKVASSPPGNGGAPQSQNDQIEREKRLQAIAMREVG